MCIFVLKCYGLNKQFSSKQNLQLASFCDACSILFRKGLLFNNSELLRLFVYGSSFFSTLVRVYSSAYVCVCVCVGGGGGGQRG